MHGLTNVLVASIVKYWRIELNYASDYNVCSFTCFVRGSCKVMLTEEAAEKQMASVLSLFSLSLFSSIHCPISLTQF